MWIALPGQNTGIYLCPMWTFTPGWLTWRRILIIKYTGWPIWWIPCSPFPEPLQALPNVLVNKVTVVAAMEVMHGLPVTKGNLAEATAVCPVSQLQSWLQYHFSGWSDSYMQAGGLHWTTFVVEGAEFCSFWNRFLLWKWTCLPRVQCHAFAKSTICGPIECCRSQSSPHSMTFD